MNYEIRAFTRGKRGRLSRVKSLTKVVPDPYSAAVEMWRLSRLPEPYIVEVRDLARKKGHLAPLVSYEELLRRAGTPKKQEFQ